MIITENINSPLSIDDTNLDWGIDWAYTHDTINQKIYVTVDFWNLIDGEKLNQNNRVLSFEWLVSENANFNIRAIKNKFFVEFPILTQ